MQLPSTVHRVPQHTDSSVNDQIRRRMRRRVAELAEAPRSEIDRRLAELDQEWDIERVLETNASLAMLTTLGLAATVDRRWLFASAGIAAFLFQHAVQGWCPPVPIFRRLGFRTSYEIDEERYALKVIRGDFDDLSQTVGEDDIHALERLEGEGGNAFADPPVARRNAMDDLLEAVRS